jgi:molybdenum cofactor cytidylyltransferase
MGSSKPLLPFAESHFLGRLLEEFCASKAQPIVVVLGHQAERIRRQITFGEARPVMNENYRQGMLSSIRAGILELSKDPVEGALICPVDHPKISRALVDLLIRRFEETKYSIVLPVVAKRRGHPVLFSRDLFEELLHAPDSVGARQVVRDHADDVLEVETDDSSALLDVDTPEDYRKLMGRE